MSRTLFARVCVTAAVLPLIGGVLVACGNGSDDTVGASGECIPDETSLNFGVHTEVRGFDVVNGGTRGIAGGHERAAVFDALMEYDLEAEEFVPRMAESFEPNEDFTEWTMRLDEGIEFGSGNPVTTEAVVFSVDRHGADDTVSLYKSQMDVIESVDVVDDLEMTFHLSEPQGDFDAVFAGAPGMLADPEVFEDLGEEQFALNPGQGGAGAYEVSSYTQGEELVLERKDDYRGEGEFCVGTLRFVFVENEDARRDAFLNGELDAAYFYDASIIDQINQEGYDSHMTVSWGDPTVLINHGTGGVERPGEDVRVRKAIAHALDPEVIDQRANDGTGLPSSAVVTEESVLWSEGLEGPAYDRDLARGLLDEAKADGYDGQITLSCDNAPKKVDWAIAVEAMLETVGFEVNLDNSRRLADHRNLFFEGNYDLSCFAMSVDDTQMWSTFQTTLGEDPVAQSRVGYQSEAMSEAMAALRAAGTTEDRQEALRVVQEVWNEEAPMAITGHSEQGVAWQDHVEGLTFTNGATTFFDHARVVG